AGPEQDAANGTAQVSTSPAPDSPLMVLFYRTRHLHPAFPSPFTLDDSKSRNNSSSSVVIQPSVTVRMKRCRDAENDWRGPLGLGGSVVSSAAKRRARVKSVPHPPPPHRGGRLKSGGSRATNLTTFQQAVY